VVDNLGCDVPWHFTAFHPDYRMQEHTHTPLATLRRARDIARAAGVNFVYTGNVRDEDGGTTRCSGCGERLIVRDGYRLTVWGLRDDGCCRACGTACPGVFDGPPGGWGARRQPVRLADFAARASALA
jgi:pyruvate formate lyase activating enzyme